MSLEQWVSNAWLKRVRPSQLTVTNLLAIADRDISDASLEGISTDGRFTHAYDAVRALAEAALHASGYDVPKGAQQHQRVIESLRFTVLGELTEQVDYLDRCRRMRHQTVYERMGTLQQRVADELLGAARDLRDRAQAWLESRRPELMGA